MKYWCFSILDFGKCVALCEGVSVGDSGLLEGIGNGFVEALLHVVDLKSFLVSSMVKMTVTSCGRGINHIR